MSCLKKTLFFDVEKIAVLSTFMLSILITSVSAQAATIPTLTNFSSAVDSTLPNTLVEVTYAELLDKGDEADDGSVTGFVVQAVSSGTLKIGATEGAATAYAAVINDTIDGSNNAYWTPDNVGVNAFTVKAKDDDSTLSSTAVQVTVTINMIVNGDFEDTTFLNGKYNGFVSDYVRVAHDGAFGNNEAGEGNYSLAFQARHANDLWTDATGHPWSNTSDPTSGGGAYLVANGGTNITQVVWQTSEPIVIDTFNKDYRFTAYVSSLFQIDSVNNKFAPSLKVQIGDGTTWIDLGTTTTFDDPTCDKYLTTSDTGDNPGNCTGYNAGNTAIGEWIETISDMSFNKAGSYYLRMVNNQASPGGNDFGLDDISFEFVNTTIAPPVDINALNSAPTITGTPATQAPANIVYSFTPTAVDADPGETATLVYSISNKPTWASFSISTGALTGTPSNGDIGTTTNGIVISVADVNGSSVSLSSFDLEITAANVGPIIVSVAGTNAIEDVLYTYTATVLDPDDVNNGTDLIWSLSGQPTGMVVSSTGEVTWTPANGQGISGSVTLSVEDGHEDGAPTGTETFSVTVAAVNDAPVISGSPNTSVDEGTSYSFLPVASDIDVGDSLVFSIINKPVWASFNTATGLLSGDPDESFVGSTFNIVISVSDGALTASLSPFTLTVVDVNYAPVSSDQSLTLDENTNTSVTLSATDSDGDGIVYIVVTPPGHGLLTGTAPNLTYTPDANYFGADEFTFKANDGASDSNTATVSFTINEVNFPPVSNNQSLVLEENAVINFTLTSTDADGGPLGFVVVSQPVNGVLSGTAPHLTYTPSAFYFGTDGLTFKANDGTSDSNTATVIFTINEVNFAPVADSQSLLLEENAVINFTLTSTDADGDPLEFVVVSQPVNGVLSGTAPQLVYTPNAFYFGTDSITFKANDGALDSNTASVSFTVNEINYAPEANGQSLVLEENAFINFTLSATDDDGDAIEYVVVTPPVNGVLSGSAPNLTYTPNANYFGADEVVFKANDGALDSNVASISFLIDQVNSAPAASEQSLVLEENGFISFTLSATDGDDDPIEYVVVTQPANGVLSGSAPNLIYTPNANYFGTDEITFKVNDGALDSNIALVRFLIGDINYSPVANDDTYNLSSLNPVTFDVLFNDSDPDGDVIRIVGAQTNFGQIDIVDNQLVFTPAQDISGLIAITYSIEDAANNSATASVSVTIESDVGPIITLPDDLCGDAAVNADALYTRIDLGQASAVDRSGNVIPVSLVNGASLYQPGRNRVFWQATDLDGNTTVEQQLVCVVPLVSIQKNQRAIEGESVEVDIFLNGESPTYPVVIPFNVLASDDHTLVSGEVNIDSGTEARILFSIVEDELDEENEFVEITLSGTLNLGAKASHRLTIVAGNIAPEISLEVFQGQGQAQEKRLVVSQLEGEVVIVSTVYDANKSDSFTYDWQASDVRLIDLSTDETQFVFNPALLSVGLYKAQLTVIDSGVPNASNTASVYIEVVEALLLLTDEDSDGDLIPDNIEGHQDSDGDGIADYLDRIDACNVLPEEALADDGYLIEGQPSTCLQRGIFTVGEPSGGAQIVGNGLTEDPDAANVGGIFDFIAYGLPGDGTTYAVVLPQRKPIPPNAVYRKFNSAMGSWGDFVEDANNSVWSSQGEPGYCPPPNVSDQNNIWTAGLGEGHWCVQLIIEDGGLNDDDAEVNGTIVDPGGVSVMNSPNHFPVAVDDTFEININNNGASEVTIDVLGNDTDEDGDTLVLTSVSADIGNATQLNGFIVYTPLANFIGNITIAYGVSDNNGGSDLGHLSISIFNNNSPVITGENSQMFQSGSIGLNLLDNDSDPENDELTLIAIDGADGVTFSADGQATFTPNASFFGNITLNYTVQDSANNTSAGQWQIEVVQVKRRSSGGGAFYWVLLGLMLCLFARQRAWNRQ